MDPSCAGWATQLHVRRKTDARALFDQLAFPSMGAVAARVATGVVAAFGLLAALAALNAQAFESRRVGHVIVGPMVGAQVVAALSVLGAVCWVVVGIVVLVRSRQISRGRATKAWTVAAGIAAFIVAAPLVLEGAWTGAEALLGTQFTDLGSTSNGSHIVIGETTWSHTNATVYRQRGW